MKRGKEEGAQLQKHFKLFQALESEPHQATWGLKGDTKSDFGCPGSNRRVATASTLPTPAGCSDTNPNNRRWLLALPHVPLGP